MSKGKEQTSLSKDLVDLICLAPNLTLRVNQATKKGYIDCKVNGVFDAAYPNSTLRRARVQMGGMICGAITCAPCLWTWSILETE